MKAGNDQKSLVDAPFLVKWQKKNQHTIYTAFRYDLGRYTQPKENEWFCVFGSRSNLAKNDIV